MSVLIRGMEMPTTCRDCRLSTFTDFDSMPFCNITMDDICLNDWETKRCDNCHLVPVQPHGRLIDADALEALFWDGQCYFTENIKYKIKNIETIFPAEEGET